MRNAAVVVAAFLVLTGCASADGPTSEPPLSPGTTPTEAPSTPTPSPTVVDERRTVDPVPRPERVRLVGIDASHHQGAIDWRAVAGDGISFAYLKASEGTTYTDPTFADHRAAALDSGLRVGGYHYFQLCSPGLDQAAHFAAVLGDQSAEGLLPPAVDLELAGSCDAPPARDALLAEVRAFLDAVEDATGVEPVVYLFPELEERFGFAAELADHRQWVRSLDGRPDRRWWIWQQTDSGAVAGIAGPVDVNVMWSRELQE